MTAEPEMPISFGRTIEQHKGSKLSGILLTVWEKWLQFATVLGTIQMWVILTVIYWTLLPIIAIPFKFLADPLTLRRSNRGGWV